MNIGKHARVCGYSVAYNIALQLWQRPEVQFLGYTQDVVVAFLQHPTTRTDTGH